MESWWESVVWGLESQKDVFRPLFYSDNESDSSDSDANSELEENMEEEESMKEWKKLVDKMVSL